MMCMVGYRHQIYVEIFLRDLDPFLNRLAPPGPRRDHRDHRDRAIPGAVRRSGPTRAWVAGPKTW